MVYLQTSSRTITEIDNALIGRSYENKITLQGRAGRELQSDCCLSSLIILSLSVRVEQVRGGGGGGGQVWFGSETEQSFYLFRGGRVGGVPSHSASN